MKNVNEKFTDEEYEKLKKTKDKSGLNWHDFIMSLTEVKK